MANQSHPDSRSEDNETPERRENIRERLETLREKVAGLNETLEKVDETLQDASGRRAD
jgi:chaperonin cofactor prefoldin